MEVMVDTCLICGERVALLVSGATLSVAALAPPLRLLCARCVRRERLPVTDGALPRVRYQGEWFIEAPVVNRPRPFVRTDNAEARAIIRLAP